MLKIKGKTYMVEEPSHVKQLSLNHLCKIGLSASVCTWNKNSTDDQVSLSYIFMMDAEIVTYKTNQIIMRT